MKPVRAALRLALAALLTVGTASHAAAAIVEGMVTRVSDGDTLWVRPAEGGRPIKIRLDGVDAPEICQPGGREARQALEKLVLRQPVTLEVRVRDDYGRRVATLRREGRDVGEQLVRDGQAWNYRFRGVPGPYVAAENEARLRDAVCSATRLRCRRANFASGTAHAGGEGLNPKDWKPPPPPPKLGVRGAAGMAARRAELRLPMLSGPASVRGQPEASSLLH